MCSRGYSPGSAVLHANTGWMTQLLSLLFAQGKQVMMKKPFSLQVILLEKWACFHFRATVSGTAVEHLHTNGTTQAIANHDIKQFNMYT